MSAVTAFNARSRHQYSRQYHAIHRTDYRIYSNMGQPFFFSEKKMAKKSGPTYNFIQAFSLPYTLFHNNRKDWGWIIVNMDLYTIPMRSTGERTCANAVLNRKHVDPSAFTVPVNKMTCKVCQTNPLRPCPVRRTETWPEIISGAVYMQIYSAPIFTSHSKACSDAAIMNNQFLPGKASVHQRQQLHCWCWECALVVRKRVRQDNSCRIKHITIFLIPPCSLSLWSGTTSRKQLLIKQIC